MTDKKAGRDALWKELDDEQKSRLVYTMWNASNSIPRHPRSTWERFYIGRGADPETARAIAEDTSNETLFRWFCGRMFPQADDDAISTWWEEVNTPNPVLDARIAEAIADRKKLH